MDRLRYDARTGTPKDIEPLQSTYIEAVTQEKGIRFCYRAEEQPTLRPVWKVNLVRQTGYQITQTLRFLTGGSFFPKVLLCTVAQKKWSL